MISISSLVVRGENKATRKAIPKRASRPNRTSVHKLLGVPLPVTGITPGVVIMIAVAGTTVTAGSVAAG